LPCARTRCTSNIYVCRPFPEAHGNIYVCRAFFRDARQTYVFVVCFTKAHGKVFFKKLVFVLLFISPIPKHYFVLYISIW
jgi:hypothetical protein